ncbi:MAG: DUF5114 domain-containing protein [Marinilabiliaceae bacterium]|nr:DUF5114 domain-containing protein [Marinilabiliaceae bacterium]
MRHIKSYIAALSLLLTIAACDKEGDQMVVSGLEASQLTATTDNLVLNKSLRNQQVLSLVWSSSDLTVSDESAAIPSGFPIYTLQASASEDFSKVIAYPEASLSHSFTGAELNTLANTAGLPVDVASPLYFRMLTQLGNNLAPAISQVIKVSVTPYFIDMTKLFVLSTDKSTTLATLSSPTANGEYAGFISATGWMNVYMMEGDDTLWGNDGVTGKAFALSSDTKTHWNCWFPGSKGCYYITMSTHNKAWTATFMPDITVGGDVSATLTFDTKDNLWKGTVITTADNANITLSSKGAKYDVTTGDTQSTESNLFFAESSTGVLTLAEAAGNIAIAKAGTYTLKIDLNNATQWTYELTSGIEEEEEEVITTLYLPGIDDKTKGGWVFDSFINQSSDEGIFIGVVYVDSNEGFIMHTVKDDWSSTYFSMGETEGSLVKNGSPKKSITAPAAGTYILTVNLNTLTYSFKALGDVLYLYGLNDAWNFNTTIAKTGNGTYSGTAVVTQKSEWGFKLAIEDGNWDDFFGGYEGTLYFKGGNITDDATPGTYTINVDLINGTYQMTLQ